MYMYLCKFVYTVYYIILFGVSMWLFVQEHPWQSKSDFTLYLTAALPAAPHGASDWGQLCPFRSLWQRPAQRREPLIWYFWQRFTRWGLRLLFPTGLQGAYLLTLLCLNRVMCVCSMVYWYCVGVDSHSRVTWVIPRHHRHLFLPPHHPWTDRKWSTDLPQQKNWRAKLLLWVRLHDCDPYYHISDYGYRTIYNKKFSGGVPQKVRSNICVLIHSPSGNVQTWVHV